jgi:hypothetical protein
MAADDECGRETGVKIPSPTAAGRYFTGKKLNNFRLEGLL